MFAPTDEAFAKLPWVPWNRCSSREQGEVSGNLTYHVVPGKVMAKDVVKLCEAKTVQGSAVKIVVDGTKVSVDGANVVKTDIETSNGVIHIIDSVILQSNLQHDCS